MPELKSAPTPPSSVAPATPAPSLDALGPELRFLGIVWQLNHALVSTSRRMRTAFGVTGPERYAIRVIGRFPGITPAELARVLRTHRSTATVVVSRLEKRGFLRRKDDPRDARRQRLTLTAKGKVADELREGTVESSIRDVLARLPAAQVGQAEALLRAISDELADATRRARGAVREQ